MPDQLAITSQQVRALQAKSVSGIYGGVVNASNQLTFAHGAPFTPTNVQLTPVGDATANTVFQPILFSVSPVWITISFYALTSLSPPPVPGALVAWGTASGATVLGYFTVTG